MYTCFAERDFHPTKGSPALWMVKPSQNPTADINGSKRPRSSYAAAGAYEPNEGIVAEHLKNNRVQQAGKYRLLAIPPEELSSYAQDEHRALDAIVLPLRPEYKPLGKSTMVIEMDGVLFERNDYTKALFLNRSRPEGSILVDQQIRVLHLLLATVNPGDGDLFRCDILASDGRRVTLAWKAGENIGPSVGRWDGKLKNSPNELLATAVVSWQGEWQGQSVRLFHAVWRNDNEWYPVDKITFKLQNLDAQVAILGATAE